MGEYILIYTPKVILNTNSTHNDLGEKAREKVNKPTTKDGYQQSLWQHPVLSQVFPHASTYPSRYQPFSCQY